MSKQICMEELDTYSKHNPPPLQDYDFRLSLALLGTIVQTAFTPHMIHTATPPRRSFSQFVFISHSQPQPFLKMATPRSPHAIRILNQTAIWYMAQPLVDGLERWCKVKSGSLPDGSECCVLERRGAFNQYHHEHPEISDIGQMKDNLVINGFWYRPDHDGSVNSRPDGWFRWTEFGAGWPSDEEVDRFGLMRFYDSRPWWRAGANEWQRVADESELS